MVMQPVLFDAAVLSGRSDIPSQFIWPADESPTPDAAEPLDVPLIDIGGIVASGAGDRAAAVASVARLVGDACSRHGFFQVVNHGIDAALLADAHRCVDAFFKLPLAEKQRALRRPGESCGYASSFVGRFSSKLPWKETLSFRSSPSCPDLPLDFILSNLGEEHRRLGEVYARYCEEMSRVSLEIMEVLGESLGVGRSHYRSFFEGNDSIMRLNYYCEIICDV